MPRAGRGEALKTDKVTRWTDNECGTLAILEVELRGENGLSDDDYYALWHTIFPDHIKDGRDYNVVKLHETFALRHYKKKSSRMVRLCRPNKAFDGARLDKHTDDEKKWFESLRVVIRAKALQLQIILPTSSAKVDSGAMCTCPECSGLVNHRQPTLDEDGKVKKTKPRGSNAGRKRKAAVDEDVEDDEDGEDAATNGVASAYAWNQQKAAVEQSFMQPAMPPTSALASYPSIDNSYTKSENYFPSATTTSNSNVLFKQFFAAPGTFFTAPASISGPFDFPFSQSSAAQASLFTSATGLQQTGEAHDGADIEMPDQDTQANEGSDEENEGEGDGEGDGSNSRHIKLHKVRKTHSILPMFHLSDTIVRHGVRMLQANAEPIAHYNPVRPHGGPVVMLHSWTEGPITSQSFPYMLCDMAKCVTCSGYLADASLESTTRGLGFVHASQCFLDEESKTLLFAPDSNGADYAPCRESQAFKVREVVLSHRHRPEKHLLAVCKVEGCAFCQDKMLAGVSR